MDPNTATARPCRPGVQRRRAGRAGAPVRDVARRAGAGHLERLLQPRWSNSRMYHAVLPEVERVNVHDVSRRRSCRGATRKPPACRRPCRSPARRRGDSEGARRPEKTKHRLSRRSANHIRVGHHHRCRRRWHGRWPPTGCQWVPSAGTAAPSGSGSAVASGPRTEWSGAGPARRTGDAVVTQPSRGVRVRRQQRVARQASW